MKIKLMMEVEKEVKYLQIKAGVRYWEDATVNGAEDTEGKLIPCRIDDDWCPLIDLETGVIEDWVQGTIADIQYKVCDAGEYFLVDEEFNQIAKYKDEYVPDFLGSYSDHIEMEVDATGKVEFFSSVDTEGFEPV